MSVSPFSTALPLFEQFECMLNYSYTFVEEYGCAFLRARREEIVQDMLFSDILHGSSAYIYKQHVRIRKATLSHLHLLNYVKEVNQCSIQSVLRKDCMGWCALHVRWQPNRVVFPPCLNCVQLAQPFVLYTHPFFQFALLWFSQSRKEYSYHRSGLMCTGTSFLPPTFLTKIGRPCPSALSFSTSCLYSNMLLVIDVECMRQEQNQETPVYCPGSPIISSLGMRRCRVPLRWVRIIKHLQLLLDFGRRVVPLPLLTAILEHLWTFSNLVGWP